MAKVVVVIPLDTEWMFTHWRGLPACVGADPALFEPMTNEESKRYSKNGAVRRCPRLKKAVSICLQCPVMVECREHAQRHHEVGVWGGEYRKDNTHPMPTGINQVIPTVIERKVCQS